MTDTASSSLPLVTVGVASFNNAAYLRATLDSIHQQTYPHIELLIVDDCSRDESAQVAEAWLAEHPEVNGRLIQHPTNLGVCRVCNDILSQAQGEYVGIIGSDDLYAPNKLSRQIELLRTAPAEVGVVYGSIAYIDSSGAALNQHLESAAHSGDVFMALLNVNFVPAMSALVRRQCYEKVGMYDEQLGYEDWDMWLRLARHYHFLYDPCLTAHYRIHTGSATFRRRIQLAESSLQLLQKHWGYSTEANRLIADHTRRLAETLYHLGSTQAKRWLLLALQQQPSLKNAGLLTLATLGIPAKRISQLKQRLHRRRAAS